MKSVSSVVAFLLVVASTSGCGYVIGHGYSPEVRTVAVPVFGSDSFRRGLEFRLTEAVQEQVKTRTPYLIAKEPYADTRLSGRIVTVQKGQLSISPVDQNRELQLEIAVEVVWEDLNTGRILAQQNIPLDPQTVLLVAHGEYAPETGQSYATGSEKAIDRLAQRIVDMMETPW